MGVFRRTECQNKGSGQVGDKAMEKEKNSKNIMDYATVTLLDAENAIESSTRQSCLER